MLDKLSKLIKPEDEEEIKVNARTNDIIETKYPGLAGKIVSNKKGIRFIQIENVIDNCIDKKNIEKSIKNLLVNMKLKQEDINKKQSEVEETIINFFNEIGMRKEKNGKD